MATILHSLSDRVKYKSKLGFDPLLKPANAPLIAGGGGDGDIDSPRIAQPSSIKFRSANVTMLTYATDVNQWVGPFIMAMVMCNCVRRSHVLNNYSSALVYREGAAHASWMAACVNLIDMVALGLALASPPVRSLLLATGSYPIRGH